MSFSNWKLSTINPTLHMFGSKKRPGPNFIFEFPCITSLQYIINQQDATLAVLCLLTTTSMLYMFRTPFASIIRSTINCDSSHYTVHRPWHLYRIYSNPTHDKHQWLLLQFIVLLMTDAKGIRNMYSILVVVNKHNTAIVASCWLIIYYTKS